MWPKKVIQRKTISPTEHLTYFTNIKDAYIISELPRHSIRPLVGGGGRWHKVSKNEIVTFNHY